MRSRSTQISRSSTPRTMRGEDGGITCRTPPPLPPQPHPHFAAPTPVRTNTPCMAPLKDNRG